MAETITEWQGKQIVKILESINSKLEDIKDEVSTLKEIRRELLTANERLLQIELNTDRINGR